jgi:signal transduction histidine kinase/CheY-like chemotaxis protein
MEDKGTGKRMFERLTEIHRAVAASLGFDEVLRLIVSHAAELVDAEPVLLLLADDHGNLCVRAAQGLPEEAARGLSLRREEAVAERLRGLLSLPPSVVLTTVPVVVDPSLHGMLVAAIRAPGGSPEGERAVELLEALANTAAVALVHTQIYEKMRSARFEAERRSAALMRLQEASADLLLLDGEVPSHDRLIEILCNVTGAPRGVSWLMDETVPAAPVLVSRGTYSFRRVPRNETDRRMQELMLRVELSSSHPMARAARTMSLVALPDTEIEEASSEVSALWSRTGIRSVLVVPLRARGRVLGVVALCWHEAGRCCDEATIHTAEVIANQLAAVLDTAALVDELSRASRLKDEFLATLSHELRNPLNVIVGYAEILSRNPDAQRLPLARQAAEVIRRNAMTQAQLVSDLLDLSRLQTGKLALHRQPVALVPLLTDAAEGVRGDADAKGIRLEVETSEGPLPIEADAVRVRQILWNLLHNAVKFTPEGGKVTIRLDRDGGEARLTVEDTGQGMDAGFLPEVFEMFRQAEAGLSRRHGGLGIGLSLVRQLVELHGGRVRAESEGEGRGSRFTVWLPVLSSEEARATGARPVAGALAGVRVLVVDDSEDTVAMLFHLLKGAGAEVETASSGPEALRRTEDAGFDVILSDLSMPVMDGYELLRELKSRPKTAGVPVLAVTGFGQTEDVERTRAAGFFAHLAKPVQLARLIEVAREAIEQPSPR